MSTIDIIQTIGIVASLTFAIIQMRFYIKAEKISVVTRISERNDALLNDILEHHGHINEFSKPFGPQKGQYFSDPRVCIMYRILNFFDEMLYYHEQKLVSEQTWELYQSTLRKFLDNPFARSFWECARDEYNPALQRLVDKVFAGGAALHPVAQQSKS
jgi:hypothetical protein